MLYTTFVQQHTIPFDKNGCIKTVFSIQTTWEIVAGLSIEVEYFNRKQRCSVLPRNTVTKSLLSSFQNLKWYLSYSQFDKDNRHGDRGNLEEGVAERRKDTMEDISWMGWLMGLFVHTNQVHVIRKTFYILFSWFIIKFRGRTLHFF